VPRFKRFVYANPQLTRRAEIDLISDRRASVQASPPQPRALRFGSFELDLESEELKKDGIKLKLSGQPFQMLAMIAGRGGNVVTYEELEARFWPQTHIEDPKHSLGNSMLIIRKALGDSARGPLYIETVRRGFRCRIPVTIIYKDSGQENSSKSLHPDELTLMMQQIRQELLNTQRCRELLLLLYRCDTLEHQNSRHPMQHELQLLMLDIRLALERSAVLEPNWADHSISFETATRVFNDPNAISVPPIDGRRKTLGRVSESVLLVVEHTAHHENGQQITTIKAARRATPKERRFYQQPRK
jgi:DNA-binding winged helix-turn-helix (wHTH) protein/uncharacterized DUF497 family protein